MKRTAAFVLLCMALQGCATRLDRASYTAPVAEEVRRSARTVAVVSTVASSDLAAPRVDVQIGQGESATAGAVIAGGTGLFAGVVVSVAGGPIGVALAPVVIPAFTLGGMAGGAAVGWSTAVPAKDAEAANAALARSRFDLSAEVARRVASRLPSVGKTPAPADGAAAPDLRVEVAVDRWGLAGGTGADPLTGFYVAVSYRVVNASDNMPLVARHFVEAGPQRPVSAWTRDHAALLSQAVDTALSRAAEAVAEGAFLVHDFRIPEGGGGIVRGEVCGLMPVSPRPIYRFGPFDFAPPRVDSLAPRLVWRAFPSREDVQEDTARILARVSEIRYDLRVWRNEHAGPGELVYERTGLALAEKNGAVGHKLESPLGAGSSYLWSARARFRLDGEERVTRWSYDMEIDVGAIPLGFFDRHPWLGGPVVPYYQQSFERRRACVVDSIPPLQYFGFRTP